MNRLTLAQLAEMLGGTLEGDGERVVGGVASLEAAGADEVSFLANPKYARQVATTRAAAVIVGRDHVATDGGPALIRCDEPYLAFRNAMVAFHGFREHELSGVDPAARIDPSASLGEDAAVGPFATVARDALVGARCVIYPGVYVGPSCRIGEDCVLYPNVTLYDGTILGDRVTIHAGSSIGHDGFGYATHDGVHHKIPQAGHVEIGDDCELGACCAVDRATMGATVIGPGTKFSNLVAIGHGTRMGRGCLMVAQSGLAGSVEAGNYCVFAGQAGVVNHVKIGDFAQVAAQSGVHADLEAGTKVMGSPSMPLAQGRRASKTFQQLPDLRKTVKRLERELAELRRRLGGQAGVDGEDEA